MYNSGDTRNNYETGKLSFITAAHEIGFLTTQVTKDKRKKFPVRT
jgi:hypothetical protein